MYRAYAGELQSVYFGGGTPTMLPASELCSLLDFIGRTFILSPGAEITVECNPGTVDVGYLAELKSAGFNRLSIGAQSFQDAELKMLGRLHNTASIRNCVAAARHVGFDNISLDIIYALPGQTLASLQYNLLAALKLAPEHISLYSLQLDNDSIWGREYAAGKLLAADEDLEADMLQMARGLLREQGFAQYEIANFARRGERDFRSRHNCLYWQREDYLGVGLGAASCLFMTRWQNVGTLDSYIESLSRLHRPKVEQEQLTMAHTMSEVMFMGLRQTAGVDIYPVIDRYCVDPLRFYDYELQGLFGQGLLEYVEDAHSLRLTERGMMLANQVFLEFIKDETEDIQLGSQQDEPFFEI